MSAIDIQTEVEQWIREVYLPKEFGQSFKARSLPLQSRGESKFSAVSEDGEVVVAICSSRAYIAGGKVDADVLLKVKSDALKILWLETTPARRFMLFTDPDMIRVLKEEKKKGHFPKDLEIKRVKLPTSLEAKLAESKKAPD